MLQGLRLDTGTAGDLIHASKAIKWSSLYPLLTKLAEATWAWTPTWSAWGVLHFLRALEGLDLLLGKTLSICSKDMYLDKGQIMNSVSFYPFALLFAAAAVATVHVLYCVSAC